MPNSVWAAFEYLLLNPLLYKFEDIETLETWAVSGLLPPPD